MTTTVCGRCKSSGAVTDHQGRQDGAVVWTILRCPTCNFSWRDSEPASAIGLGIRSADFAVDAANLDPQARLQRQRRHAVGHQPVPQRRIEHDQRSQRKDDRSDQQDRCTANNAAQQSPANRLRLLRRIGCGGGLRGHVLRHQNACPSET